jgi:thiamine biosynthesis protein ThiI
MPMSLYLVRYGELGLKSPKVKKRFQSQLKRNIEDAFLSKEVQCISSMDWGRIYLHTDSDAKAEGILSKIFGITSFSRVIETTSEMKDICDTAAQYSKELLTRNASFAVRARRTGDHKFTSQDAAAQVGVNLKSPDVEIFVEIRHNRTFIFSEKIKGPGGFPIGSSGKVLAVISDRKSVYAAWLLAKRGCNTRLFCLDENALGLAAHLKAWFLYSKPISSESSELDSALRTAERIQAEALILGRTYEEFSNNPIIKADIPVFYPLIGLSDEEIEGKLTSLFGDDF